LNNNDWDKKIKTFEMQLLHAQEERDLAGRQRKQAVADREDLQHEVDAIAAGKNAFVEEKRRFEARVAQLEEELDEDQTSTEQLLEKYKRGHFLSNFSHFTKLFQFKCCAYMITPMFFKIIFNSNRSKVS
jgi:hypothetical protein